MLPLPGIVQQAGFVVTDLDQALRGWLDLGIGPWFVLRRQVQRGPYLGTDRAVTVSLAFANSGDLQLELIQPEGDTPGPHTDFLRAGPAGLQQLAWWSADFEADLARLCERGWPVLWSGGEAGSARFAYLEPPNGPVAVVELMERTPATDGLAALVARAARDWDGRDPIRDITPATTDSTA